MLLRYHLRLYTTQEIDAVARYKALADIWTTAFRVIEVGYRDRRRFSVKIHERLPRDRIRRPCADLAFLPLTLLPRQAYRA